MSFRASNKWKQQIKGHRICQGVGITEFRGDRRRDKQGQDNSQSGQEQDEPLVLLFGKNDSDTAGQSPEHSSHAEKKSVKREHISQFLQDFFCFYDKRAADQGMACNARFIGDNAVDIPNSVCNIGIPVTDRLVDVCPYISGRIPEAEG